MAKGDVYIRMSRLCLQRAAGIAGVPGPSEERDIEQRAQEMAAALRVEVEPAGLSAYFRDSAAGLRRAAAAFDDLAVAVDAEIAPGCV